MITETPGLRLSREQLSMVATRYQLAASLGAGGALLEVACGPGVALEYMADSATFVVGGDIDANNIRAARELTAGNPNVGVVRLDAQRLPFATRSFDTVILLDSIYWVPEQPAFFSEAARLLRPGGRIMVTTVNRRWHGFNPHPYASRYLDARELDEGLRLAGFDVTIRVGYTDEQSSLLAKAVADVRRVAIRFHLIPAVNRRKESLKRIFYGPLVSMPARVNASTAPVAPLRDARPDEDWAQIKMIYAIGTLPET